LVEVRSLVFSKQSLALSQLLCSENISTRLVTVILLLWQAVPRSSAGLGD